jgi:F-type H+-transporting ATPase subunit delta
MLAEPTLARPYARAAFDLAQGSERVAEWSEALSRSAAAVRDEAMRALVDHPRVDDEQMLSVFDDVLGDSADKSFEGFLRVLMHYRRLALLPAIAEQFEQQRRASEQRLKVNVTSAVEMQPEQLDKLTERLRSRFGRDIELETDVDSDLIGGLVVRAGDKVIDASVRGRLERLENRLMR